MQSVLPQMAGSVLRGLCEDCAPKKASKAAAGCKGVKRGEKGQILNSGVGESLGKAMRWTAKDKAIAGEVTTSKSVDMKAGCEALVAGDERVAKLEIEAKKELVQSLNEGNIRVAREQNKAKFAEISMHWVEKFVAEGMTEDDAMEKAMRRMKAMGYM
jgi:hypothetical protein